jgi:hypothetical protein
MIRARVVENHEGGMVRQDALCDDFAYDWHRERKLV